MRYITLTEEVKKTLEQGLRNHGKHHLRQRCHALLLSGRGIEVKEIAFLQAVRTRTVYC